MLATLCCNGLKPVATRCSEPTALQRELARNDISARRNEYAQQSRFFSVKFAYKGSWREYAGVALCAGVLVPN
jgi:hypothetical protein